MTRTSSPPSVVSAHPHPYHHPFEHPPLPPHLRFICRCRGQVAVRRSGFAARPVLHNRGACSKPRRSARCRERTGMTPRRRSLRRARRPGCAMVDGPRSSSRIKDATARCRCAWVGLCKRDAHEHTSHLASQPNPPPPRPHHHQVQVLPASQLLRSGRRLSGWAKAASKADPKIVLKLSELPHGVSTNQVVCAATMVIAHTCRAFATADDVLLKKI